MCLAFADSVLYPHSLFTALTKINPAWLSSLGRTLCTFSKPVELPSTGAQGSTIARLAASTKAAKAGDAAAATPSREVYLVPSYGAALNGEGAGGLGWELPPVKAVQRLVQGRWVTQM